MLEITEYQVVGNKKVAPRYKFTFYIRKVKHYNREKQHWKIALGRDSLVALCEWGDFADTEQHLKFDTAEEALIFFKQTDVYKRHYK